MKEYLEQIINIFGQHREFRLGAEVSASPIAHAFASDFSNPFKDNFTQRLKRLHNIYFERDNNRKVIITRVNNVGLERNWDGAFAELSAYDYLNRELSEGRKPVTLSKIPATPTLARHWGKEPDLDCYFEDFDVYMDVKVLKDNVTELLEGIYSELKQTLGTSNFHITEDRPLDLAPEIIKHHRKDLLDELANMFEKSGRPTALKSKVIPQILFRFQWESGWNGSFKFYNPYRHAQASYKLAFEHSRKYVERKPFLLLFVIFPWFNGVISRFGDSNRIFYRSFSRRVFCEYINCGKLFKALAPAFNSNLTVCAVSKKLSGIMFLEDHSITASEEPHENYSAYVYLNPNADNSVANSAFRGYLLSLPRVEYDDFEFDNY